MKMELSVNTKRSLISSNDGDENAFAGLDTAQVWQSGRHCIARMNRVLCFLRCTFFLIKTKSY